MLAKSTRGGNATAIYIRGGSRIFLGGGAPLRNGVTNINKPVVLESHRSPRGGGGGGGCAHPLHPPPRSAPVYEYAMNIR